VEYEEIIDGIFYSGSLLFSKEKKNVKYKIYGKEQIKIS
jgi:hypothetical protein